MAVKPLYKSPNAKIKVVLSPEIDLDNGNGTTRDYLAYYCSKQVTVRQAKIVYTNATTGTVAAASAVVGTTVGGAEIVAATNYENSKAVGATTSMTLVAGGEVVPANTPILVRHTGVASTQAGMAHVVLELELWDD
jgi:hypothetical protein